jgi:hypothetical protein
MKRKLFGIFGMLAVLLALCLVLAGCDNGSTTNNDPKELAITNLSSAQLSASSIQIGIFPAGTTSQQAMAQTSLVAGSDEDNATVSGTTATFELWDGSNRWTGSGTYDIYIALGSTYYRKTGVAFTSATISVDATTFESVSLGANIKEEYQGTWLLWGYHNNFSNTDLTLSQMSDSSYDSLKASVPASVRISGNSCTTTGGLSDGQTFSGRTDGNILFATLEGTEQQMGTFVGSEFRLTYYMTYASQGAYTIYKK